MFSEIILNLSSSSFPNKALEGENDLEAYFSGE
jgi:hypothetical protein